jgi:predicted Zn-dependent protease with MMP-like domain
VPRSDRLADLVDVGFAALDDGDLDAAAHALDHARRLDPAAPGVRLLEAAVADGGDEPDRAIEIYQALADEHPDDPLPHLHAAGTHLYSRGDAAAALREVDAGLDLVDDEDDLVDGILLRIAALIALDRAAEAREALEELDSSALGDIDTVFAVAEAALAAGAPDVAIDWIEQLTEDDELAADAYHLVGRAHDATGDAAARTAAWLETLRRDAAEPDPPWHLTGDGFERVAADALGELPPEARAKLDHVPILIDAAPSQAMVEGGTDPRLLGLFEGTPMPDESAVGGAPAVTTIHLFQRNLEAAVDDPDDLVEQIWITVLHETAHFFGLDEDALEALGLD